MTESEIREAVMAAAEAGAFKFAVMLLRAHQIDGCFVCGSSNRGQIRSFYVRRGGVYSYYITSSPSKPNVHVVGWICHYGCTGKFHVSDFFDDER